MNRSYLAKKNDDRLHCQELIRKTAIHEAGHVAAIHLGNQAKQLPPVFFQIFISEQIKTRFSRGIQQPVHQHFAKVKGGRLIHSLPFSLQVAVQTLTEDEEAAFHCAFEADIINLLAGPLAEAKYVALHDDEPINPRLVNLDSLRYYGGASDLKTVREYLDCLLIDQKQKDMKVFELFLAAYDFINAPSHWNAITALADFIIESGKEIIHCEEAIDILDKTISNWDFSEQESGLAAQTFQTYAETVR